MRLAAEVSRLAVARWRRIASLAPAPAMVSSRYRTLMMTARRCAGVADGRGLWPMAAIFSWRTSWAWACSRSVTAWRSDVVRACTSAAA